MLGLKDHPKSLKTSRIQIPDSTTLSRSSVIKTVFAEMSSQSALTKHLGTKTTFYNKYIKAVMFGFS